MGLVEGIPGKRLYQVKHLFGKVLRKVLLCSPFDETLPLLSHQSSDLLAHGLPHHVGLAQAVPGEGLKDQQHLVLVHDHPVGLPEDVLQGGMGVLDVCLSVLRVNEGGDVFHGARAVQGDHGCYIVHRVGTKLLDVATHTGALQLEYACGLACGQEAEGLLIVQRNVL